MTNCFCDTCGTLMYRLSELYPDFCLLRLGRCCPRTDGLERVLILIGTVDDLNPMEGVLERRREAYVKDRVSWFHGMEGAKQSQISV
jgi:hypothetical protein